MHSKQIRTQMERELQNNNYAIFTMVKQNIKQAICNKTLVHEAFQMLKKDEELSMLCNFTYREKDTVFIRFQTAANINRLLKQKQQQGIRLENVELEYLCIFKDYAYEVHQIIEIFLKNNNKMYDPSRPKLQRNLTIIPRNAIMKDGKRYGPQTQKIQLQESKVMNKSKTSLNQSKDLKSSKNATKEKQNNLQTKQSKQQLPRLNVSKTQPIKQEQCKSKNTQPNKQIKNRKLLMQSDQQGEEIYTVQKFMPSLQMKKPQPMEIQNQGNYHENKPKAKSEHIQIESKIMKAQRKQEFDEQDQDQELMKQMAVQKTQSQMSNIMLSKTQPQYKAVEIGSKVTQKIQPPAKSINVASKQGSISSWINKK